MGIERGRFRGVNGDFGGNILVRDEDDARAIFILETTVAPEEFAALFTFGMAFPPPLAGDCVTCNDGEGEEEGGENLGGFGGSAEAFADERGIEVIEVCK